MSSKCLWLLVMAVAVLLIGSLAPVRAQGAFLAGAAKAKITPQGPVWIAGYEGNRRSVGVHDDLWARALVLRSGGQTLAIASVDLLGFPNIYLQRVRQVLAPKANESILVAATHVHSAPDVIGLWGPSELQSGVDQAYVDSVIKTVARVIQEATANLAPASVKYAAGEVAGVSKNIRVPEILDTGLTALQVVGKDGKVIATLVNFACHPEIMHNKYVTADFPNWIYQRVEGQAGGVALFLNGAQGGMVTGNVEHVYDKGQENWDDPARIGNAIADQALEALAKAPAIEDAPIAVRTAPLRVPLQNPQFEAAIAAGLLPDFRKDGQVDTEVAAGTIGRAEFCTIPGEAFPNIGFLLRRWMTGDVKFVFGLTQDELGYIMSREDWGLRLYRYESSMSQGPEMGYRLVEALHPLIEQVNPKPRAQ